MNGRYDLRSLKTITLIGTGELRLALGKMREKTSRNCSILAATLRMSFSLALPVRKKCLDFTLVHASLAATGESSLMLKERSVAERRARQKAKINRFILLPPITANVNRSRNGGT